MSLPLPNSSVINRYLQSHFKRRSPYQRNHLCKWQATCSPHPLSCNPHTSCHHPLSGLQRCPPPANCPKLCHIRKLNLRFLPCHKVLLHHIQLCYVSSLLMSQSSSKFPLFLKPSKETVQGSPWTSSLLLHLCTSSLHRFSSSSPGQLPGTGIFSPTSLPDKSPFKHDPILLPPPVMINLRVFLPASHIPPSLDALTVKRVG